MTDMKGKEKITLPSNASKLTGDRFASIDIMKFTDDPIEQKMIDRFGLVCPSCTKGLLKNFCPDCGSKTIVPNFCKICNLESSSQFCENCGTVIYSQGMDPKKFLYLSGNNLERQLNKLVALLSTPSDYQFQIFSLIEIVIQVLSETRKEISILSEKFKKLDDKLDVIDGNIIDIEHEIERSIKSLIEKNSEIGNKSLEKMAEFERHMININTNLDRMDCNIIDIYDLIHSINQLSKRIDDNLNRIEEKGVYNRGFI